MNDRRIRIRGQCSAEPDWQRLAHALLLLAASQRDEAPEPTEVPSDGQVDEDES